MSVRSQLKAWMPVIVAGGVLAAGALVAIPFGGWDTVQLRSAQVPEQPARRLLAREPLEDVRGRPDERQVVGSDDLGEPLVLG